MSALNQEYFDRPESLRIAQGQSASVSDLPAPGDILGPDGRIAISASNGGIEKPQEILIPASTTLIRFANAPFVHQAAAGAWWLDFPNYRIVESYADEQRKPVQAAMRELCAVPVEWSSMTLLIQAVTRSPLVAYSGRGKPAVAQNMVSTVKTIDPLRYSRQHVMQLYIPGLQSPDLLKQALIVRGYALVAPEISVQGYNPELAIRR